MLLLARDRSIRILQKYPQHYNEYIEQLIGGELDWEHMMAVGMAVGGASGGAGDAVLPVEEARADVAQRAFAARGARARVCHGVVAAQDGVARSANNFLNYETRVSRCN